MFDLALKVLSVSGLIDSSFCCDLSMACASLEGVLSSGR